MQRLVIFTVGLCVLSCFIAGSTAQGVSVLDDPVIRALLNKLQLNNGDKVRSVNDDTWMREVNRDIDIAPLGPNADAVIAAVDQILDTVKTAIHNPDNPASAFVPALKSLMEVIINAVRNVMPSTLPAQDHMRKMGY